MLTATSAVPRISGLCLALAAASPALAVQTVTGHIVCDNHYQVYSGTMTGVWFEGGGGGQCPFGFSPIPLAQSAALNGPLVHPALNLAIPDDHFYLYVVAWSDDSAQQGILFDIVINGTRVTSLSPFWEVFATNDDRDTLAQAPSISDVFTQISLADTATGGLGSSIAWVPPSVGGCNNGTYPVGNPWPHYAPLSSGISWIWYNSGQQVSTQQPFFPGFNHREYLIFRHPICRAKACPADLNGDGVVNAADMALLLGSWGPC